MTRRALVLCPGRGSYSRAELGSLQGRPSAALDAFDAMRAARGLPGPRALDAAERFSPRTHIAGEHASILTAGATLADIEAIDRDRYDIVGVMGNSMGWYTALGAAGALSLAECGRLIETMGAYQQDNVVGGQIVYPLVDDAWRRDAERVAAVEQAVARTPDLFWSIHLGGQAILGGTDAALKAATDALPRIEGRGVAFPLRLPLHSAFHTPLLQPARDRAAADLADLAWTAPHTPLIDGRGQRWRPAFTDRAALAAYTLGHQVTRPYDFTAMVVAALGELAPDVIILPGPGSNLGGALGQVLVALGWQGLRSRDDFQSRQADDPFLLAMGRPEQRSLVVQ